MGNLLKNRRKNLDEFLGSLSSPGGDIAAERVFPERPPSFGEWPCIDSRLRGALSRRGIDRPYSHQAQAIEAVLSGKNVVTVTPTASGKTLCYNVPVMNAVLEDDSARALYIFPTKALSQDQLAELYGLIQEAGAPVKTFTYDGDTPPSARTKLRAAGHIVITNPDMLNTGILPHHTKWIKLFENLRYVVIDELHTYRGVFGSHVANLFRRLKRVCSFYGSSPQFICSSATISNPGDLAGMLLEEPVEVIAENGAPGGKKRILLYNPPVVNSQLGIRRSSLKETARIAGDAVSNGISTIVFTRSRINVELLLTYIRRILRRNGMPGESASGYRGGYLPNERRDIEKRLRDGSLSCVVSTNALELGIDIGSLELAVLHGYPGSVASTWQQMGRAGRRSDISAAVLVASSFALDQFLAAQPDYFFGASPEQARIDADNLYILASHIKCGAFELPFSKGEMFGNEDPQEILEYLEAQGVLHQAGGRYHWQADSFPAESLSLRSATSENYVIIDTTERSKPVIIGEVDRPSAPMLIHPEAVYFHGGEAYQVTELDSEGMRCYVKKVNVDYYTDADMAVRFQVLDTFETQSQWGWGEVLLASRPTVFKKIRLHTHENIGYGHIHLPEEQMHTTACWFSLPTGIVWEGWSEDRRSSAITGLAHLMNGTAPLFLMCDRHDLRIHSMVRDPFLGGPAIYLADNYPGGVGLAEAVYGLRKRLLEAAAEALAGCPCEKGCPACVGALGSQMHSKRDTRFLLDTLLEKGHRDVPSG